MVAICTLMLAEKLLVEALAVTYFYEHFGVFDSLNFWLIELSGSEKFRTNPLFSPTNITNHTSQLLSITNNSPLYVHLAVGFSFIKSYLKGIEKHDGNHHWLLVSSSLRQENSLCSLRLLVVFGGRSCIIPIRHACYELTLREQLQPPHGSYVSIQIISAFCRILNFFLLCGAAASVPEALM